MLMAEYLVLLFSGSRVDRVFTSETVDSGSITGQVKPKMIKIGLVFFRVFSLCN